MVKFGYETSKTGFSLGTSFEQYQNIFFAPSISTYFESLDTSDKVDGTQYTENILNPAISVSDPLAQTFRVESFDGGVMASSIDLYFSA